MSFDNMTTDEIRIYMTTQGWFSDDRLTNLGWGDKYGYSIWFNRWDWHGQRCDRVDVHAHTSDLDTIREVVAETAQRALATYEKFPYQPPNAIRRQRRHE